MLLNSGHIFEGKTSRRMKVYCFTLNERVYNALRLTANKLNLSASFLARGWLVEVAKSHRIRKFDSAFLRKACEDVICDRTHDLTLGLNNATVRELNRAKDKVGCHISGLVNLAILLGLKQFAQHHADPSLRAEIEKALFGERSSAEALETKEGNSVAAA